MKILVIIDDERNGSGPFIVTLRKYKSFSKINDFNIKFLVFGSDVNHQTLINEGFDSEYHNFPITYARENIFSFFHLHSKTYKTKKKVLSKIIDDYQPNIIDAIVHPISIMVHSITEKYQTPILVGVHSTHKWQLMMVYRLALKKILNSERVYFLCVSNWIKQNVLKLRGRYNLKSKVIKLYNGIELNENYNLELENKNKKYEIVFVAQIRKEKGTHIFLNVCEEIFLKLEKGSKLNVNIYGRGFDEDYNQVIEKMIAKLNSKFKDMTVINKGFTSNVTKKISNANLLLVTSLFPDPLPTVIMEAQSVGVPVLGFNRGGIPELVDYNNDFLIKSNTISEMVEKSIAIITSKNYSSYREKARNIAEKYFDIKIQSENFNKIIKSLKNA